MDIEQRALQRMRNSIETAQSNMDQIAGPLCAAAQLVTNAVLAGGKILTCGNAMTAATAQQLATYLSTRFEHDRPSIPAIALGLNNFTLMTIATRSGFSEVYSRSIQSLGQENDILVVFSTDGLEVNLIQAVSAAHERGLCVIAITGHKGGDLAELLQVGDVEIRIDSSSSAQVHELQLLIIHTLCDLIDHQLFGVE